MKTEVEKLRSISFIKEVDYPTWLDYPKERLAHGVNYTNLNRACPKDSFPSPRIDQLVDATTGHALLSFMDAYSGYNHLYAL